MSLIIIFVFVLFCAFAYLIFYKKNYADDQNKVIIEELLRKDAKKHENVLCTISISLSFTTEPFDVYKTNNSIVLIRAYSNLLNQKYLNKQAETYLIIIREEGFKVNLFTNYIKTKSIQKEDSVIIVTGDLYCKAPFSSSEFIYSSNAKIKLPIKE